MPPGRLDTEDLHTSIISALEPLVERHTSITEKPLVVYGLPPLPSLMRIYAYNLTAPPGGRPDDEHKIQLMVPGQARDHRANFDYSDGAAVVLLGASDDSSVFVLWDAYLHRDFSFSANAQVRGETLVAAIAEGIGIQDRNLRSVQEVEQVIAVPAWNLVSALERRFQRSQQVPRLVDRSGRDEAFHTEPHRSLAGLSPEPGSLQSIRTWSIAVRQLMPRPKSRSNVLFARQGLMLDHRA